KDALSPLELRRHELGAQVSNLEALGSKPSGSADSPTAHRAPAECHPQLAGLTRTARSLDPGATCPRCDSNAHCPPPHGGASCHWATRTWSLRADLNRLPVPYEGTALPGELQRHGCPPWIRTTIPGFRARCHCRLD